MVNKILNALLYIVVVSCFILLIIFQKNLEYVFIILSFLCFFLGIIYLLKRNRIGILSIGIGLSGFVTYGIYYKKILTLSKSITLMVCLSICIIIILTILFMFINYINNKKKYSIKLDAMVKDIVPKKINRKDFYKPLYIYTYDKQEYIVENTQFLKYFVPNIGDKRVIYINEKDHSDVFFPPKKFLFFLYLLACLFFILLSILVIIKQFV